jgi:hypothetical protein
LACDLPVVSLRCFYIRCLTCMNFSSLVLLQITSFLIKGSCAWWVLVILYELVVGITLPHFCHWDWGKMWHLRPDSKLHNFCCKWLSKIDKITHMIKIPFNRHRNWIKITLIQNKMVSQWPWIKLQEQKLGGFEATCSCCS